MAIYAIKDLEKLSGIKAHTLRIWEQRYGLITPKRTPTNIRYYDDEDLKFILNIALLNRNGIKISKIAQMNRSEITGKVSELSDFRFEDGAQLDALTLSMIEMDEYKFERIVSTNIQQTGFERTMLEVIYPFLDKLSLLWLTGSIHPVQESFISNLIRQKLIVAIDKLPMPGGREVQKLLLYLPEGERQELTILFMHYLAKARGYHVVYLGLDVSLTDLRDAQRVLEPDFVFTMITETFGKEPVQRYVDKLSEVFAKSQVLLSGYQVIAQSVLAPNNTVILNSLEHTLDFLKSAAQPQPARQRSLV
ncbi:MAG: MerR family transcriptional regulator [Saprospiraceae bacterium]|nr:MerR family transcriptional regulator [Saprospiraceae bacterium]